MCIGMVIAEKHSIMLTFTTNILFFNLTNIFLCLDFLLLSPPHSFVP